MKPIRVAIAGAGNCASSLVQGTFFYKGAPADGRVPGLMHTVLGGYHIGDIEFACAFDVNAGKVGLDLSDALLASPNNTIQFATVPHLNAPVLRGPTLDGLGKYLRQCITESDCPELTLHQAASELRKHGADVLVCYMPVGSQHAVEFYAHAALEAGCGFVNCVPVFIASTEAWSRQFAVSGIPIVGDDIKSQVGTTITHRVLTRLFDDRGVKVLKTYQLNFGGNTDFMNMLERERLESKKISKTGAVTSQLPYALAADDIHVGPSDYVPFLTDRKFCEIRIEGETFGGVPLLVTAHLEVWDSPNSAGVVIDALRCCRLALDNNIGGPLLAASAYLMKTPPMQLTDDEARHDLETWIMSMVPVRDAVPA